MTDKRIPKTGEVWTHKHTAEPRPIVNVYPDAVTFMVDGQHLHATTLDDFLARYVPPEPTVVLIEDLWFNPLSGFVPVNPGTETPGAWCRVGTIAAMSAGTFRFEAVS